MQRASAPFLLEAHGADVRERGVEGERELPGAVGAAVVGDGDPVAEGEALVEVVVQAPDARAERGRLVVDRDDDVHDGRPVAGLGRQQGEGRSKVFECGLGHAASIEPAANSPLRGA